MKKESIDHIFIHVKTRILWHLLFSLCDMSWVLHFSFRETLLGQHDSFVGKKGKKCIEDCSFMLILYNLDDPGWKGAEYRGFGFGVGV